MSDPNEVLAAIARARNDLAAAKTILEDAKSALKETVEYEGVQDAKEDYKTAQLVFDGAVQRTSAYLQPALISEVLEKAAEEINAGALDAVGVKCTATVQAHAGA